MYSTKMKLTYNTEVTSLWTARCTCCVRTPDGGNLSICWHGEEELIGIFSAEPWEHWPAETPKERCWTQRCISAVLGGGGGGWFVTSIVIYLKKIDRKHWFGKSLLKWCRGTVKKGRVHLLHGDHVILLTLMMFYNHWHLTHRR